MSPSYEANLSSKERTCMLELLEDIIDLFWWIAPFVFCIHTPACGAGDNPRRGKERHIWRGCGCQPDCHCYSHHLSRLLRTGAGRFCNFTGKCLRFLCSLEGFRGILYYYILRHQIAYKEASLRYEMEQERRFISPRRFITLPISCISGTATAPWPLT